MLKDNQTTSIGNISDADVTAWPKTLDKVKAKFPSARYVVPGHGNYGGTELIEHTKQIVNQYIESTSKVCIPIGSLRNIPSIAILLFFK